MPAKTNLGALISSGKDSLYSMYKMIKQGHKVSCLITVESENKDSFMFHTPTIRLVELQSEALGIPLITQITKGKKENELKDLKKAIKKAKEKYNLDGIITGALFSNYQKERIENICSKLSLKVFNPLWHLDQEAEMREIVKDNFEFIMTKVAAEGIDKTWLNKKIDNETINKLVKLNKKTRINIAGEGGEFETLVLDCPLFKGKISIKKHSIIKEDKNTATLIVEKTELLEKVLYKL